jgi:hypothetical protein
MNDQGRHENYSKNKSHQQGLHAGLADPARKGDQFRKGYLNKEGDQKAYEEVAWLVEQMNDPAHAASVSDMNYARWGILTPASIGSFNSEMNSAVEDSPGWLAQAQDLNDTVGQFSHVGIFGPITGTQREVEDRPVVTTPESTTSILLGTELLGLGTLIFLTRRRTP